MPRSITMKASTSFEIADKEYLVSVDRFYPPSYGTRDDPPDDGETSIDSFVLILKDGETWDVCTLETFTIDLAIAKEMTEAQAEDHIYDAIHSVACDVWSEMQADDFDDGPPYEADDRDSYDPPENWYSEDLP